MSSKKGLISPDQSFFDHAIYDALKEAFTLHKLSNNNNQLVPNLNIKDHQQLTDFITTSPEFVQSIEKAEPSNPVTIQNIFNEFLDLISPLVYESSDPLVKKYFDDQLPTRTKGPGRDNKPGPFYNQFKEIKNSFSLSVANLLALFLM